MTCLSICLCLFFTLSLDFLCCLSGFLLLWVFLLLVSDLFSNISGQCHIRFTQLVLYSTEVYIPVIDLVVFLVVIFILFECICGWIICKCHCVYIEMSDMWLYASVLVCLIEYVYVVTAVTDLQEHACILRVRDQNGISRLYNMFEIYHSGREPSI